MPSDPISAETCPELQTRSVDATTLAVSGDVDAYSAPHLATALADHSINRVDLSAVTFIDAAGLTVLLTAHRARPHGLTLCSSSRYVLRLLDLTGRHGTFPIATA